MFEQGVEIVCLIEIEQISLKRRGQIWRLDLTVGLKAISGYILSGCRFLTVSGAGNDDLFIRMNANSDINMVPR